MHSIVKCVRSNDLVILGYHCNIHLAMKVWAKSEKQWMKNWTCLICFVAFHMKLDS